MEPDSKGEAGMEELEEESQLQGQAGVQLQEKGVQFQEEGVQLQEEGVQLQEEGVKLQDGVQLQVIPQMNTLQVMFNAL